MGITISAKNSKYDFDMGYGGFFNLRKNIAIALDKEFGEIYAELTSCWSKEDFKEHDRKANKVIEENDLEKYADVLDFLYASDTNGEISYKTCGRIHELIKNVDFGNKGFRYAAHMHNDYGEFKDFLKDCYSHHKKMQWY